LAPLREILMQVAQRTPLGRKTEHLTGFSSGKNSWAINVSCQTSAELLSLVRLMSERSKIAEPCTPRVKAEQNCWALNTSCQTSAKMFGQKNPEALGPGMLILYFAEH